MFGLHVDFRLGRPHSRDAIVLLSGGLDSTVALWLALHHYKRVRCISLDYGQKHRQELRAAERIARLAGVAHDVVRLDLPWSVDTGGFVRGHNALLLSLAATAVGGDKPDIVLGTLASDPYEDATSEYLLSVAAGFRAREETRGIHVSTPLKGLRDKGDVLALGLALGAPVRQSWSCRTGSGRPCATCPSCVSRARSFEQITDRTGWTATTIQHWQAVLGSPYHAHIRGRVEGELKSVLSDLRSSIRWRQGWRYRGPDGAVRFTSFVVPHWAVRLRHAAGTGKHVRVAGLLAATHDPWEILIAADGRLASTANAPDLDEVRNELVQDLATQDRDRSEAASVDADGP